MLICLLAGIFDVDLFVRTLAVEVLSGNFDGIWNANNYYLYYNYDVNQFQYFRHDVSSSFGVWNTIYDMTFAPLYTWGDGGRGYRLINRVLANEPFRSQFTNYTKQLLENYYHLEGAFVERMEFLNSEISPLIQQDQWRFTDYAFSYEQFLHLPTKGYSLQTGANWEAKGTPEMHTLGIKEFMALRIASVKSQLE